LRLLGIPFIVGIVFFYEHPVGNGWPFDACVRKPYFSGDC